MARKREQRLRRKARAQLAAVQRDLAEVTGQATELRTIALLAIRFVGQIDAPNPHEPFAIAKARDLLRHTVHAYHARWRARRAA